MTTMRSTPVPKTAWFTTSVSGEAPFYAIYDNCDDTVTQHPLVYIIQHEYPIDSNYHKIPGSDWVDSRVILGDVNDYAESVPVSEFPNLVEVQSTGGIERPCAETFWSKTPDEIPSSPPALKLVPPKKPKVIRRRRKTGTSA